MVAVRIILTCALLLLTVIVPRGYCLRVFNKHATGKKRLPNRVLTVNSELADDISPTMALNSEFDQSVVLETVKIPLDKNNVILDLIDNVEIPVIFYTNPQADSIIVEAKSSYHQQGLGLLKYEVISLESHNHVQLHIGYESTCVPKEVLQTAACLTLLIVLILISILLKKGYLKNVLERLFDFLAPVFNTSFVKIDKDFVVKEIEKESQKLPTFKGIADNVEVLTNTKHQELDVDEEDEGKKVERREKEIMAVILNTMRGEENDIEEKDNKFNDNLSHSTIVYKNYNKYLIVLLVLTFLVGVVCAAVTISSKDVQLHIGLPDNLIRKVRMYSDDPDIRRLHLNRTVLSLVSRLQLYDKRECNEDLSLCETYAICDGASDSLACRCKRGYFYDVDKCSECSSSCPNGHYMTSSCTTGTDVVCKECTACHGSQYEAAVCSSTKDSICVDVSFPTGFIPPNSTSTTDGTNFSTSSSSNVFLEKLKDMKELETTMYITNNQQSLDFVWKRESGLEIKISVSGVYLVPEYVDLDHEDDGLYFLHYDKNISEEIKKKYKHVVDLYCRHPIPDYYSLHYDTIKNRLTSAEEIICDSQDKTKPRCPPNYQDGQKYLKRHINNVCSHSESSKRLLELSSLNVNNIICDEESELLTKVFGQSMPDAERLRYPSEECNQYSSECLKCLKRNVCGNKSMGEDCCSISCYSNSYCLQYYRSTCPPPPVQCAKGNINQFGLIPVFEKIGDRYMCHLKYKKPQYLYNVSYTVTIPNFKHNLPERNFTFTTDSLESHQTQRHKKDFLNIMHDTKYKLEDEVIVIAKHEEYNDQMGEFQLHPLKKQNEFNSARGFKVKQDAYFSFSTLIQFYRPFSYSSTTWNHDGCLKNLSKVFPNQTQYKSVAVPVTTKVLSTKNEKQYQMYKKKDSPIVKLTIDEAESVLSFFQSSGQQTLIRSPSLKGSVLWNPVSEFWTLQISGAIITCPGILKIEIYDKLLIQSLGVFDVFIHCSEEFWINFEFGSDRTHLPDVFIVHINDSITSHKLVLSSVVAPRSIPIAGKMSTSLSLREEITTQSPPWIIILVFIILSLLILWMFFVFYLCLTVRAPHNYERTDKQEMMNMNEEETEKMYQTEIQPKRRKISLCIVYLLVFLYFIYCIFATFSISFGILYAYQKSVLPDLSQLNDFSDRLQKRVNHTLQDLKLTEIREMDIIHKQSKSRERACKHHLHQTMKSSIHAYSQITEKYLETIYVQNGTLQYYVQKHFVSEKKKMHKIITDYVKLFNQTFKQDFSHFLSLYKHFLISVVNNKWLEFPREIFSGDTDKMKSGDEMSNVQIKKFVSWLQIDKAESLMSVTDTISKRLSKTAPVFDGYHPGELLDTLSPTDIPNLRINIFKSQNYMFQVIKKNNSEYYYTADGIHFDAPNTTTKEIERGRNYNLIMYLLIILFIVMDVILWFYRISWLCKQIKLSKVGYEVKIPTDESSRKIHMLLTGHHPPSTVDVEMENAFKYFQANLAKDRVTDEEYISYIQSYPKCKEDILRDIWAYKKTQSAASVTKGKDFCINECMTIIHWIHRCVLSTLNWRSTLTCGALILISCLIYAVDNWFNQANIEVLVGADVVVTELQWQTVMINRHLADTVDKLNLILYNMKDMVDSDVSHVNQLLADTFHKQTRQIVSVLLSVCKNSGINDCNIDISILLQSTPPPITTCNFLPLQQHIIDDVDTAQITALVIEELSPLLKTVRGLVFCILTYLIFLLCFVLLCNAGIRLARYYLLIMGKFPILQIYQISDSLATYADAAVDDHPHIYRSASLSCESGVYVGETEESTRE